MHAPPLKKMLNVNFSGYACNDNKQITSYKTVIELIWRKYTFKNNDVQGKGIRRDLREDCHKVLLVSLLEP